MNRENKQLIANIVVIVLVIAFFGWMIWGVCCAIGNFIDNVYPLQIIDSHFDRAMGASRLNTFADYTQDGLDGLDGYSGNNEWLFPTIKTDVDSIKEDLALIILNAYLAENMTVFGSDSYQEALDDAKQSLTVQKERIAAVITTYMISGKNLIAPVWTWFGIFIGLMIALPISMWIADEV